MTRVTKQFTDVMDGVNNLIKAIKADYCNRTSYDGSKTKTDVMLEMEEKFKNGVSIKNGQKYIGIYTSSGHQSSIWGGVAKKDSACGKVKKGDILKAAGYNAPALNSPRGNVLDGNYPIQWTGPLYLK